MQCAEETCWPCSAHPSPRTHDPEPSPGGVSGCRQPRLSRLSSQVRIALQLDDGSRLQGTFCSGQTLWELLSHFPQTR